MGMVKYILYDGIKAAVKSSRHESLSKFDAKKKLAEQAAKEAAEKYHTSKSAVTVGDVQAVIKKVEETRSDVHLLGHDMVANGLNHEKIITQHIDILAKRINDHGETLKCILDVLKHMNGMG